MLKQAIVTLIAFLAIASAFNATLEDSLFYLNLKNGVSDILFQTRGGIIGFDFDFSAEIPSIGYILINLETKSTSAILSDIIVACSSTFDALHYHVATSSLLYYCVKNNSLLIIDQTTYTVELTIPTNFNTTFIEINLVPQGYSLAVLGTSRDFSSELITFDLQSQTVANHIVFNYGLSTGEQVVGYAASSQNSLYILTKRYVDSYEYEVTLYSMFLIGSSYTINNISSRNYTLVYPYSTDLYSVGNLLVVSYNQTIDMVSAQGNVLGTVQGLVALTVQSGNSDFYALLQNGTLLEFVVQNGGYSVETFATGIQDMHYITSNLSSHSLLFTIDNANLFNITDLQSSQPLYSTLVGATHFMTTDTTYAVIVSSSNTSVIYVFSRETNLLIYQGQIGLNYFYDPNSHLLSYMDQSNDLTKCNMVQFNIQTTNSYVPFVLHKGYDCPSYSFFNVSNDLDNPQFLLNSEYDYLYIMSENYGLVGFGLPYDGYPFVDYDTLTLYVTVTDTQSPYGVRVYVYTFNPNNSTFTLQNTTEVDWEIPNQMYEIPGKAVLVGGDYFQEVEMITPLNITFVDTMSFPTGEFFQDKTGDVYLMIQDGQVYYANQITELPGKTASTFGSSSAGLCRYTLNDQTLDLTMIRFFNVCPKRVLSPDIYA